VIFGIFGGSSAEGVEIVVDDDVELGVNVEGT
jgi:hypothetical protein